MRVHVTSLTVVAPTGGFVSEPNASSTSNGIFYGVLTGTPRPVPRAGHRRPRPAAPPARRPNIPRFDENPERIRVDSDGQEGAPHGRGLRRARCSPTSSGVARLRVPDLHASCPIRAPSPDQVGGGRSRPRARGRRVHRRRLQPRAVLRHRERPGHRRAGPDRRRPRAPAAARPRWPSATCMRSPGHPRRSRRSRTSACCRRWRRGSTTTPWPRASRIPATWPTSSRATTSAASTSAFLVRTARVSVVGVEQDGLDATYINPQTGLPELLNDRPPLVLRATVAVPGGPAVPDRRWSSTTCARCSGWTDPGRASGSAPSARPRPSSWPTWWTTSRTRARGPRWSPSAISTPSSSATATCDVMGAIKGNPAPADQVVTHGIDVIDPDLINLVETIDPAAGQRYSYVFDGNAQVLDHVLITQSLSAQAPRLRSTRATTPTSRRRCATWPRGRSGSPTTTCRWPSSAIRRRTSPSPSPLPPWSPGGR